MSELNITESQLFELDVKGRIALRDWWEPKRGDLYYNTNRSKETLYSGNPGFKKVNNGSRHNYPLLTEGQMIDFLKKYIKDDFIYRTATGWDVSVFGVYGDECWIGFEREDLCDALWAAVKAVLEQTS